MAVLTNSDLNSDTQAAYFQQTMMVMAVYAMVYFVTMMTSGGKRFSCYTKEYMAQFNKEHQAAFGTDAPVGGHPDDGNGYFSKNLTYLQWYDFNNA